MAPVTAESAPAYKQEVLMASYMRSLLPAAFPELLNRPGDVCAWGVSRPIKAQEDERPGGHVWKKVGAKLAKAFAVDVYLDAAKPAEKTLGTALFETLNKYRERLGIRYIIWDMRITTKEGGIVPYTIPKKKPQGSKSWQHRDHLHVEFDPKKGDEDHSGFLRMAIYEVKEATGRQPWSK